MARRGLRATRFESYRDLKKTRNSLSTPATTVVIGGTMPEPAHQGPP
jgi:hypothetical protein